VPYPTPWAPDYDPGWQPVAPKTQRTWRLLPDHIRAADDGTLEALIDGVEDALRPELLFLDAAGAGQPVDPATTPTEWLPWLARLLGADIAGLTDAQARWYLARRARSAKGSMAGIADAVAATLIGTRYVRVDRASLWALTVTVATEDIVDITVTQAAAERHTPAGATLTLTPTTPVTLAQIDATYASLAGITATGKTLNQLRFG
jgi:hypothetical protein